MTRSKNIGFIGLGSMGEGMALNLVKNNFSLVLFDINKHKYEKFSDYGCTIANSSAEVIKNASTIFTVLPGPKEVEEVILDAEGLLANSFPGDLIVDFSTVLPETSDNLFNACQSKEVSFVDSPIGRLAKNAWDGTSMFMIGAKEIDYSRIKPFLEAMGTTLVHCGEPGTGTRTKLCNNFLAIGSCMLNAEFIALTQGFELDLSNTLEVIHGTTATNGQLKMNYTSKVFKDDLKPGFEINLAHKDFSLIMESASSMKVPMPIGASIRESISSAKADGWGKKDFTGLADYWCERAHVKKARMD